MPRHLQAVPPPSEVAETLALLVELDRWFEGPPAHWSEGAAFVARVEAIERAWPYRPVDAPSLAQVIEHRFVMRCWQAWVRDAKREFPDLDPTSWPEPVVVESDAATQGIKWPRPWDDWMRIYGELERFLSVRLWRARMLDDVGQRSGEEASAVPALVGALEVILGPWLEGNATLVMPGQI